MNETIHINVVITQQMLCDANNDGQIAVGKLLLECNRKDKQQVLLDALNWNRLLHATSKMIVYTSSATSNNNKQTLASSSLYRWLLVITSQMEIQCQDILTESLLQRHLLGTTYIALPNIEDFCPEFKIKQALFWLSAMQVYRIILYIFALFGNLLESLHNHLFQVIKINPQTKSIANNENKVKYELRYNALKN